MQSSNSGSGSIGLGGVLFVVFLVLKLAGVIDWSWWWVTSPLWIPITVILALGAIGIVAYGVFKAIGFKKK